VNIFVLDEDPVVAAEYHCDKHVVKMILECGQMLCASHWLHLFKNYYNGPITDFKRVRDLQQWLYDNTHPVEQPPWKLSHMRHPCTLWTNESFGNYQWHWKLGVALCKEYTRRYKKIHKCEVVIDWLGKNTPRLMEDKGMTPFVICMKDEYKVSENPIDCYREYYLKDKVRFAKWKTQPPHWWRVNGQSV
jgi:hypothetical protein